MRISNRYLYGIAIFALLSTPLFWSCGDEPREKPKPLGVSKKIPTMAKPAASPADQTKAESQEKKDEPGKESSDTAADEKSVEAKRIYDPAKRLDPFVPLFRADDGKGGGRDGKSKRKKRVAQTPLERISLEQLQLKAVIRAPSGNRALVEDSGGKGYIIKSGTYIGLNAGIITKINADSIVVEEEKENLMGELVLQNTEIKLQKATGE